jgi:hypothetical protein
MKIPQLQLLLLTSVVITCLSPCLSAQDVIGETEIYCADIKKSGGKITFSTPVNISRHKGYDNQPCFTSDSRFILFSSERSENGSKAQQDIYRYSIKDSSVTQFTNTPESEFSPAVMPEDGQSISVVRVEADSTQRLWQFDAKGANPRVVLEKARGVGYYSWVGSSNIALFMLGAKRQNPITLQLINLADSLQKPDTIDTKCGRCLRRIPSSIALSQASVSYVHKTNDSLWVLKRVNLKNRIVSQIFPVSVGSEDYAWMQGGTLLMGKGLKLTARHARKDYMWRDIADFSAAISKGTIKRIAISPDEKRIAFVVQE